VPLDDTIDYILKEVNMLNKLPKLSSRLLFKHLLCNVAKNTVFSFNHHLYKQSNMGNLLSLVLADIFMAKHESDVTL